MLLLAANVELALEGERDRSSEIQSRNFSVSDDESRLKPGNLNVVSVEDASVMLSAFRRSAREPLSGSVWRNHAGSFEARAWEIWEREGGVSSAEDIVSLPCSIVSVGSIEGDAIFFEKVDESGVSSVPALADCVTCLAPDSGGVEGALLIDSLGPCWRARPETENSLSWS